MLFLEGHARLLSILHGVAAGVLLGGATHLALASRRYLRPEPARVVPRSERTYATVTALAFAACFALGAVLYPTYKVRVRAEYLDAPQSVVAELALRHAAAARLGSPMPDRVIERGSTNDRRWVGHVFDIKEHWVALGLGGALVLLFVSRFAHPSTEPRAAVLYVALTWLVCIAAWTGALLGLLVVTYRSVGSP